MKGEPVSTLTGLNVSMTAEEARGLYGSLYRMCHHLEISSPSQRDRYPWAEPLFDLYDLLNEGGFSE